MLKSRRVVTGLLFFGIVAFLFVLYFGARNNGLSQSQAVSSAEPSSETPASVTTTRNSGAESPKRNSLDRIASTSISSPSGSDQPQINPFYPIMPQGGVGSASLTESILTPSSVEDVEWMIRNNYPRLADIQEGNAAKWEKIRDQALISRDANARDYASNVAAAIKYQQGDPGWKDMAGNTESLSAFSSVLLASDAVKRSEPLDVWHHHAARAMLLGDNTVMLAWLKAVDNIEVARVIGLINANNSQIAHARAGSPFISAMRPLPVQPPQ